MASSEARETGSLSTTRPRVAAISGDELMMMSTLATVVSFKATTNDMEAQQKHNPTAKPGQPMRLKWLSARQRSRKAR